MAKYALMNVLNRENQYILQWRPKALQGDSVAMSNIAASYRILGNLRLSAGWYRNAAEQGDGDAMTDWGYCLQHGIGVRRDETSAECIYRRAIASKWITDSGRQEAMYHLAVILLGRKSSSARRTAANLLRNANADGDYPQAEELLLLAGSADVGTVCICRRNLRPRLAKKHCTLHGSHKANKHSGGDNKGRALLH